MGEGESCPARLRIQPLWKLQTMGLAVPSPVGRERVRVMVNLFELRLLFGTCLCTIPKWPYPGIAMMPYGLLLMSVCDQDPVIETVGMAL